ILDRAEFAFLENTNAVSTIELDIMNYQISPESSQSAQISLIQRNKLLKTATIAANEVQTIAISNLEKPDDTLYLHLRTVFDSSRSAELKKEQVIFLREIRVNGELQNIASIDYPYVSRVSQGLLGTIYTFWGKEELDPWSIWHMHSIVYEKTIDFWWIKYQHYWDVPQNVIRYLFVANCALFVGSSFVLSRSLRDQE
ncbi:MAG: hypothetical protein WAU07_04285, partial [Microgenomates group bacterium]